MKEDINQALLELILPEGILEYFSIVGLEKGESGKYVYDKTLTIYLEEKNKIPEEYKTHKYKQVDSWSLALLMIIPFAIC